MCVCYGDAAAFPLVTPWLIICVALTTRRRAELAPMAGLIGPPNGVCALLLSETATGETLNRILGA